MTDFVDLFADVTAALLITLYAASPIPVDVEIDVLADEANSARVGLTARGFLALQSSDGWNDTIGRSLGDATTPDYRRMLVGLAVAAAR